MRVNPGPARRPRRDDGPTPSALPNAWRVRRAAAAHGSEDRVVRIVERAVRRSGHDEGAAWWTDSSRRGYAKASSAGPRLPPRLPHRSRAQCRQPPTRTRLSIASGSSARRRYRIGPVTLDRSRPHSAGHSRVITGHGSHLPRRPHRQGWQLANPRWCWSPRTQHLCRLVPWAAAARGAPWTATPYRQTRHEMAARRRSSSSGAALAGASRCRGGRSSTSPDGLGGSSGTGSPRSSGTRAVTSSVRAGERGDDEAARNSASAASASSHPCRGPDTTGVVGP